MSLSLFQLLCIPVIVLSLYVMARTRPAAAFLREYASIAVAAWAGEDTAIHLYQFYFYANGEPPWPASWFGMLDRVPILVPLIWPIVILSSRDVVRALFPTITRSLPLAVGVFVFLDASLVEIVAVRARFWMWAEGGHIGVPLIGLLGWAFFAGASTWVLSLPRRWVTGLNVVIAPAITHALLVAVWWGGLRWVLRDDLEPFSWIGFWILSGALTYAVVVVWTEGRVLPWSIAAPRAIAAGLFVVVVASIAWREWKYWVHAIAVAAPYLASLSIKRPSPEPLAS